MNRTEATKILWSVLSTGGTAVAQWLRYCATNRKVAGSIPPRVIGIFYWHNPSDPSMALGSTQPLTEMSTRSIYWGDEGGRCVRLTTFHYPVLLLWNLRTLTSWNPLGHSRPVKGLIYLYLFIQYSCICLKAVCAYCVRDIRWYSNPHLQFVFFFHCMSNFEFLGLSVIPS